MKKVFIVFGPPGSGKGTQAALLADRFLLVNFDTGAYLEDIFRHWDGKDKGIGKEKKLFDSGKLCTPEWVMRVVNKRVKQLARARIGLVFSGSPRTIYDAFGEPKKIDGVMDTLSTEYSKENITVFHLDVPEKESLKRNTSRLVCSVCKRQVLGIVKIKTTRLVCSICKRQVLGKSAEKLKTCPFCAGSLRKRTLDKPEVIKVRLKAYKEETLPLLKEFKNRSFKVVPIKGTGKPFNIFNSILKSLS